MNRIIKDSGQKNKHINNLLVTLMLLQVIRKRNHPFLPEPCGDSLDDIMKNVTFDMRHIKLWKIEHGKK